MKTTMARVAAAAVAVLCAAGCRTTQEVLKDYEVNLSTGNYSGSVAELTELAEKQDGSQLLWRLMAAHALYMMNDREAAIRQFDLAERVQQANDMKSVFAKGGEGALAMMTNDRVFDYDGGGLDRIFTCLYRAIDFMSLGDADSARVELNRAAQYQSNWIYDRRKELDAADARMRSDAAAYQSGRNVQAQDYSSSVNGALADASFSGMVREHTGFDPATSGDLSRLSAAEYFNSYAAHMTGVFRWLNGDKARDALRLAAGFNPNCPVAVRDFAEYEKDAKPKNQVWIWVEDGLCPSREEWRFDLPSFLVPFVGDYLLYLGMALPTLRERAYGATQWNVVAGGAAQPMAELQSVDRLARTEYDVYMRGALRREITRVLVKAGVQIALGVTSENVSDDNTRIALKVAQIGTAVWAGTTTAADLRCWTSLPKRVMAARVDRPSDGLLHITADTQDIQVRVPDGNTFVFLRKAGPTAMPVVKQVTFR